MSLARLVRLTRPWIGLGLVPFAASCSGSPTSAVDGGSCGPLPQSAAVARYSFEVGDRFPLEGLKAVWDADPDGWIALGPEDEGEPLGQLAMTTTRADASCTADIVTAVLSTTDVRVGTGAEINGKLYEWVASAEGARQRLTLEYVDTDVIVANFELTMAELIIRPNEPPRYGANITVSGGFTARKPGR